MSPSRVAITVVLSILMTGCVTVRPTPVAVDEVVEQARLDRSIGATSPQIQTSLSLDEAIARALKYNLEQRIARAEQALASGQLELAGRELLPNVMATAGYSTRDVDLTRRSRDSVTGGPSLGNPFISQERNHLTASLGTTWNMLDFGVGYINARQQSDRVLIAGERRRKAVHTLIQDVQVAFWRAYAAQALRDRIRAGVKLGEEALVDSRQVEAEGLRSPLDALRYQRQILENLRTLESLDQDLSSAKLELARLINVSPSDDFRLEEPQRPFADDLLHAPAERLEEIAIGRNADLREQHYNVRIARLEGRKAILRLFPRLSFNYSYNYDDDSYLIHNNWNDAGLNLGYGLLNLANLPLQRRLGELGVAAAEQRRVAALMVIISQVHLSRLQYANARQQFARADALSQVEERIAEQMRNREEAAVQSKLETITATTSYIITMLRRYQALANVYAAQSRVQATLGADPGLRNVDALSLQDLTGVVSASFESLQAEIGPVERPPIQSTGPSTPPMAPATPRSSPLPAAQAPSPAPALPSTPSAPPLTAQTPAAPAPVAAPARSQRTRLGSNFVRLGRFSSPDLARARLSRVTDLAGAPAEGLRRVVGPGNTALLYGFDSPAEAQSFCSLLRAASLECSANAPSVRQKQRSPAKAPMTDIRQQLRGPISPPGWPDRLERK
jgi:outer membrane protein TolC